MFLWAHTPAHALALPLPRPPQALLSPLEADLRRMMLPNTALNLRESKRNQMKDFVSVAGPLGVSHFMILTATDSSSYLRVAKAPRVGTAWAAPVLWA